jgi:hypothetical protein
VNCRPTHFEADTAAGPLAEATSRCVLAHDVRNRQAAALYLQAATRTDDAVARERLRRHAAWLISPHVGDRGWRLAC